MRFNIGDIVYHETFGLGKVLGITKYGKDNYFNIRFEKNSTAGIQSICENKDLLLSEPLYKAIKELKKEEHITTADVDEFVCAHFTKVFNDDISTSDKITLFCKEFLLNEAYVISCLKKSEKESLICNIKSDMKGYVSKKRTEELYENNKLLIDYSSIENLVENHNNNFMKEEVKKYPDVFKTGEYDLNEEQKLAVVADVDNCLVIAGAGCGKTSMIVAKVNYLVHKGINPGKILVLSYTKKTVEDLNKKLGILKTNVNAKTFHSLGLSILGKSDKCYNDNINVGYILKKILNTESQKDSTSENKIIIENKNKSFEKIKELFLKFIAEHMENENDISNPIDGAIEKHTIKDYEEQNFSTLQAEIKYFENQNTSVKGESVKSLADVKIANFLFLNDIKYEYANDDKKYGPDFIIKSGEKELGLEHFSVTIDEHGNKHAAWCSEEDVYLQQMEEKISTFKDNFIYTTQDMLRNNTLLDELQEKLANNGIILKPISEDRIKECLSKLFEMQKYKKLIDRVERAINLYKSQNKFKDILSWKQAVLNSATKTKHIDIYNLFNIIEKVHEIYEETLEKNKSIDFNDMIALAIDNIRANQNLNKCRYDYILIDEYQDITNMRYEFIKTLKEINNAKVMAVGDDWQSIYGFSGSDISLFTEFPAFFKQPEVLYIKQTYRNSQQLLNITKEFIEENPFQKPKELKSYSGDDEYPIKAVLYHQDKKNTETVQGCENISKALMIALDDILAKKKEEETVCIIGRYNINKPNMYPIKKEANDEIYYEEISYEIGEKTEKVYQIVYRGEHFNYSTIHKAKGLEWDYTVFLDGLFDENTPNSFPCALPDDDVVAPLLYRTDTYQYSEERRMLYVALTRCKKLCYWLISEKQPTIFYTDKKMIGKIKVINDTLEEYCKKTGQQLCPLCHNGILSSKDKSKKDWISCSNKNCSCSVNIHNNAIYFNNDKCSEGIPRVIRYSSKKGQWFVGCAGDHYKECPKCLQCNKKLEGYYKDILKFVYPQINPNDNPEKLKEHLQSLISK